MREVIFLKPVFKEMIWGGTRLEKEFHYSIPSKHTGECWGIAAHEHGDCEILFGCYAGKTLGWLWEHHRELFGNLKGEKFPLLVKILDANQDLSIQVHPDDEYARIREGSPYGKMECWYILDCQDDSEIIIGHHAKTKEELRELVEKKEWNGLIRRVPIHKGDFYQINPGCVHAIKKGTLILETQQNSDITYRLYDYERLQNGKPRQLHIEKCLDVITVPYREVHPVLETYGTEYYTRMRLIACPYYTVEKWHIKNHCQIQMNYSFMNVSVIEGSGQVNGQVIEKGTHFILPCGIGTVEFCGEMKAIVSWCNEKQDTGNKENKRG